MNLQSAQKKLGVTPDGVLGPKTWTALFRVCGATTYAGPLGEAMANLAADIDTPLEICHFLSQGGHETMGFTKLVEIWGPTPAQRGYEGRRDLGNTQPGDGYRFRGRGVFHLTGRANYLTTSAKVGIDLIANPDAAALPNIAVFTALVYWRTRGLSALAARDDITAITKKINGGLNGIADRAARLGKLKALFA